MSKNNGHNSDIKWNRERHEEAVSLAKQSDDTRTEKAIKRRILKIYEAWKKAVTCRAHTSAELVEKLEQLRTVVQRECKDFKGSAEFQAFTEELIGEKIVQVLTERITERNEIIEAVGDNGKDRARAVFANEAEFNEVPFVKAWSEKKGFIGFCAEEHHVFAVLEDNKKFLTVELVGTCKTSKGIEKFPTLDSFHKAVTQSTKGTK